MIQPRIIMEDMYLLFPPIKVYYLTVFNVYSPLKLVAGRIHLQRIYTISCLCLPANTPMERQKATSLVHHLPPFLVLHDWKRQHLLWGDVVTNHRRTVLAAAVDDLPTQYRRSNALPRP